jgi:hypothetical protein
MTSYRAENYTPEIKRQKMVGRELTSEEIAEIKARLYIEEKRYKEPIDLDRPETITKEQKEFLDWLFKLIK